MELFVEYAMTTSKYGIVILSAVIILRCLRSMLSERYDPETWAYIRVGERTLPVYHWENIIGRSGSADIRLPSRNISKVHAVLTRNSKGVWTIYDIFSKGGVWVNGVKVNSPGIIVRNGDLLNFAGTTARFQDIRPQQLQELEERRESAGKTVSPAITLIELTVFQFFLLLEHFCTAEAAYQREICLSFAALMCVQWLCYFAMRFINRSGFEIEILAFYLSSLGMSVAASSTPGDIVKQLLLTITGVILFITNGWWLRGLKRTEALRIPVAVLSLALLALNIFTSDAVFGARNWLEFMGFSFQPSEFVKFGFVYVGASTMDRLYRRKNLYSFIGFSAACVIALALIGDFGTALIFFTGFLVISFMRSGSIATVLLAVTGAGLGGFLAVTVKPYIAQRFASWGHVWEDIYDKGYQQTRAMSAAASGGLFGKGAGAGWLHEIFAANTDMVFAMVCEELGLIIGLLMVLAVLILAFFALRSVRRARSSYYAISACAAVSILMVQLALNVFGSLDILPFTGVTFPFVSRGGSSLLTCWMLMAFVKGADNRRNASFAVISGRARADSDGDGNGDTEARDDFYESGEALK
ncbi:MAG: FtsW/RodA/SpoVE family cell cycle protein [Candidatus Limivicinus sp.]